MLFVVRYGLWIVALLMMLLCACGSQTAVSPALRRPADGSPASPEEWSTNGPVGSPNTQLRHPEPPSQGYKWFPDVLGPHKTVTETVYLTSLNGLVIYAEVVRPVWASADKPCHGLVLVPGGTMKGTTWHAPYRKCNIDNWAAAGFVGMLFDAQGRGKSEGKEDYNGPVQRGDLKTVIEYCASRPDVLPGGVGLASSSWGCTLASATLGTYPDLPVRFWVDLEGAHNRYSATQYNDPFWIARFNGHTTYDDEFWAEREAITFQPFIRVPYIRIQSDMDHAFDYFYVKHAIDMVNATVSGPCPYARLNHMAPNKILSVAFAETYEWEQIDGIDEDLYRYVIEASMTKF